MPEKSIAESSVLMILLFAIALGAMLTGVYASKTYDLLHKTYDDAEEDTQSTRLSLLKIHSMIKRLDTFFSAL